MKTIHLYILNKKIYYFFTSFLIFLFFLIIIFVLFCISDRSLDAQFYHLELKVWLSIFSIFLFLSISYAIPLSLMGSFMLFSIEMDKGKKMDFLKQSGIIGSVYLNITLIALIISIGFFYYNNYFQPYVFNKCTQIIINSINQNRTSNFLKENFMNQFRQRYIFFKSFIDGDPNTMQHVKMSEHTKEGMYEINAQKCHFEILDNLNFVFNFYDGMLSYFNYSDVKYFVMQFKSFSHKVSISEMLSLKNFDLHGNDTEKLSSAEIDKMIHTFNDDRKKKDFMLIKYNRYARSLFPLIYTLLFILFCGFVIYKNNSTFIIIAVLLSYTLIYFIATGVQSYLISLMFMSPLLVAFFPHLFALSVIFFVYYFLKFLKYNSNVS